MLMKAGRLTAQETKILLLMWAENRRYNSAGSIHMQCNSATFWDISSRDLNTVFSQLWFYLQH